MLLFVKNSDELIRQPVNLTEKYLDKYRFSQKACNGLDYAKHNIKVLLLTSHALRVGRRAGMQADRKIRSRQEYRVGIKQVKAFIKDLPQP